MSPLASMLFLSFLAAPASPGAALMATGAVAASEAAGPATTVQMEATGTAEGAKPEAPGAGARRLSWSTAGSLPAGTNVTERRGAGRSAQDEKQAREAMAEPTPRPIDWTYDGIESFGRAAPTRRPLVITLRSASALALLVTTGVGYAPGTLPLNLVGSRQACGSGTSCGQPQHNLMDDLYNSPTLSVVRSVIRVTNQQGIAVLWLSPLHRGPVRPAVGFTEGGGLVSVGGPW